MAKLAERLTDFQERLTQPHTARRTMVRGRKGETWWKTPLLGKLTPVLAAQVRR